MKQALAKNLLAPDSILDKIATFLAPELAIRPTFISQVNPKLCHLLTARKIQERHEATDIIWLYGVAPDVWHSVLTDAHKKVLIGAQYGSATHKFLADSGFELRPGQILAVIKKITILEMCRQYMKE